MAFLKYCSLILMVVIVSNASHQHNASYVYDTAEEDTIPDETIELDYYSDDDYLDWKPFPGKFFNSVLFKRLSKLFYVS